MLLEKAHAENNAIQAAKTPLGRWFRQTYIERTIKVALGEASIIDIEPGNRVPWSEVSAKARDLGSDENIVDLRLWWGDWSRWIARINNMDVPTLERELRRITNPGPARRFSNPEQQRWYDIMMSDTPDHGGAGHRVAFIEGYVNPGGRSLYERGSYAHACWCAGQDTAKPLVAEGCVPLDLPSLYARDREERGLTNPNGFWVSHNWRGLVPRSSLDDFLADARARAADESVGTGLRKAARDAVRMIEASKARK